MSSRQIKPSLCQVMVFAFAPNANVGADDSVGPNDDHRIMGADRVVRPYNIQSQHGCSDGHIRIKKETAEAVSFL